MSFLNPISYKLIVYCFIDFIQNYLHSIVFYIVTTTVALL